MSKHQAQLKLEAAARWVGPWSDKDYLFQLLEQADEFCGRTGIGKDVILDAYTETSDWTFIIKVDALHETICRDLISGLQTMDQSAQADAKTSLPLTQEDGLRGCDFALRLLERTGEQKDYVRFLKSLRRVRDAVAHDIRSVNKTLAEMIEPLEDRAQLLSAFSSFDDKSYDAAKRAGIVRDDPGFLRFWILHQSMVLLSLIHAKLFAGSPDQADKIREAEPRPAASSAHQLAGKTEPRSLGLFSSHRRPTGSPATLSPDCRTMPATFLRHSFTHPKRTNHTRSLLTYALVFSAKALIALGGLAAAMALYSFFGIWPALLAGVIALLPLALDRWTPGAWKGHCPHCEAEIAVSPGKNDKLDFGCPVCAERITLHGDSFSTS